MFRHIRNGSPHGTRSRRKPPTERELLALADSRLRSLLPSTWLIEPTKPARGEDLSITIGAPDGRSTRLIVEAKSLVDVRSVPGLVERFANTAGSDRVIAARYLSPRTRTALTKAGLSYVDATGNVRVVLDDPGLAVIASGADRDPFRGPDRPTTSLRGAPAGRVARALIDRRPPWRMRELAAFAETSLGSTARTVDLLDREALLRRGEDGAVEDVDWIDLLRRWSEDYELNKRRRVTRALVPRGVEAVVDGLRGCSMSYAITGSLATRLAAPAAATQLAMVYAQDSDEVLDALRTRPTTRTANLLVIEPADDTPFLRSFEQDGARYAAFSQVAIDLLSGPGRDPEEADALIQWMAADEGRWRS